MMSHGLGSAAMTAPLDDRRRAGPVATRRAVYVNTASYGLPPRLRLGRAAGARSTTGAAGARAGSVGRAHRGARGPRSRRWSACRPSDVADRRDRVAASSAWSPPRSPTAARVLVPDVEFTSTLFPFLVQARPRRARAARRRPPGSPSAIDARTDVVAFSAVQMSSGRGRRPRRDRRRGARRTAR